MLSKHELGSQGRDAEAVVRHASKLPDLAQLAIRISEVGDGVFGQKLYWEVGEDSVPGGAVTLSTAPPG